MGKSNACPASICYKSLYMRGNGFIVECVDEKVLSLQTLMVKHQPEGGFTEIETDIKFYKNSLQNVTIFCFHPHPYDLKIKFAQSHSVKIRKELINRLRQRGTDLDLEKAFEIEKRITDCLA